MDEAQVTENRQPAEKRNTKKKKKPVREIALAALLAAIVFALVIVGLQKATGAIDWLPFGNKSPARQLNNPDQEALVSRLTSPLFIAAGDGSGVFYKIAPEADLTTNANGTSTAEHTLLVSVKNYLSKGTVAERITHEQFKEAASKETVTAQYSCGIPFDEFTDYYRMKTPSGSTVRTLSRLILSSSDDGSLFLYDENKDCYYRINGKRKDILTGDFVKGLTETISEKNGPRLYANNGSWIGKRELLSESAFHSEEGLTPTVPLVQDFPPEYSVDDADNVSRLEELFFPEGMDFIQKVKTSDGSLIYMYGSMEKILRIDSTGGFTYLQKSGTQNLIGRLKFVSASPGFYDSLVLASAYIRDHGGWPSEANENATVRLVAAEKLEKGEDGLLTGRETGYRFTFALEMAEFPLTYQKGTQITVELYGKEVTAYHRDLPDLSTLLQTTSTHYDISESPEEGDPGQDDASSGSPETESGEDAVTAEEEKSAFSSEQGAALSLNAVILRNSSLLSDALSELSEENEANQEQQDSITKDGGDVSLADTLLSEISSAELQLFRIDTANSPSTSSKESSGVSASGLTEDGITGKVFSSTGNEHWVLTPAWKIHVEDRALWFHALTGALLQS